MYALKPLVIKVAIFVVLIGIFFAFDGFEPPRVRQNDYRSQRRVQRAWFATVVLYVVGAVSAVWRDYREGVIHPVSYRGVFIFFGILMMLAGFFWIRAIRDTV